MHRYLNRSEAGKVLAEKLNEYKNRTDVIVLALPRGGVPVAFEVAKTLEVPLDVFIVRKLGVPGHEELALGAIATGGVTVFNDELVRSLTISPEVIQKIKAEEQIELQRREKLYRESRPPLDLKNKTVILVDDGIATGATLRAGVKALKELNPASIVIAVPVADIGICEKMKQIADRVVCSMPVDNLMAVGAWYEDFNQTTDLEVYTLLKTAHENEQVRAK